jgi:uncharacterized protein (TIGR03437 family)
MLWATYLGGSGADAALSIAVDGKGSAYVLGSTTSANFPTTQGAYQSGTANASRAFLTKLSPDGGSLVYSALLGPIISYGYFPGEILLSGRSPAGLTIDSAGNAYFGGSAPPGSLPVTAGAYSSSGSAFVAKLDPTGGKLLLLTYLGGSGKSDSVRGLAIDTSGNILAAGLTTAADFPVTSPFAHTGVGSNSNSGAFLVKLDSTGGSAVYSAVLGGTSPLAGGAYSFATGVAVDGVGDAYLTGVTTATNFPIAGAFQPKFSGNSDGFLARIDPTGQQLLYSNYLGGSGSDQPLAIAVDGAARVTVVGETLSADFPLTANALRHSFGGGPCLTNSPAPFGLPLIPIVCGDGFVAQVDHFGNLAYSTYLSGSNTDSINAVAVAPSGGVWVAGHTRSSDFPIAGAPASDLRSANGCVYSASPSATQSYPCDDGFVANLGFGPVLASLPQAINFASMIAQPVSPAGIFTIYDPTVVFPPASFQLGADGKLPATLDGWQVTFDGVPAPLLQASPGQITLIVPNSIAGKSHTHAVVMNPAGKNVPMTLPVNPTSPGILTPDASGMGQAAAINLDGSINSSAHPAAAGSIISLYVTGAGATPGPDGSVASAARNTTGISVVLGNPYQVATVLYAGPSPGTISVVMQINVQLPAGVTGDRVPIYFLAGGLSSQAGVTIAIR